MMCVDHLVDLTRCSHTLSVGCLPWWCCLSQWDVIAGAVEGSTSIMFAFELNVNLHITLLVLSMALDSSESICAVVLVGLMLGGLKVIASGDIVCIAGGAVFTGGSS